MNLHLGRRFHTTFYTRRIQSCCYLAHKKIYIYTYTYIYIYIYIYIYKVLRYDVLCTHTYVFLDVKCRHMLKHSLLGVPRKMLLLKFENLKSDE